MFTCAIQETTLFAFCWGYNYYGFLGMCGIEYNTQRALCWGNNYALQLGIHNSDSWSTVPIQSQPHLKFLEITTGGLSYNLSGFTIGRVY